MSRMRIGKWLWIGGLVVAVVVVGALAAGTVGVVRVLAQEDDGGDTSVPFGWGAMHGRMGRGAFGMRGAVAAEFGGPQNPYLAEELGITVDELEAAHEEAWAALTEDLIAEGVITEEQAEQFGGRGGRGAFGLRLGVHAEIDTYLAEALGISVEELDAARDAAHEAALADAVANGTLTQEQADLLLARGALRDIIDPHALMAEALGVSEEVLSERLAEQPLRDLLEEQGLDFETFQERMQDARDAALEEAVASGILTQEQADAILENGWAVPGAFGGRGGFRSPGDCPGMGDGPRGRGSRGRGFQGRGSRGQGFGGQGFGGQGFQGQGFSAPAGRFAGQDA